MFFNLINDCVKVVFLSPKPACHLEVITWIQSVGSERVLDNLRRDADGGADLGQAVDQLGRDVLERDPRCYGNHRHRGVALEVCRGCLLANILDTLGLAAQAGLFESQQPLTQEVDQLGDDLGELELDAVDETPRVSWQSPCL